MSLFSLVCGGEVISCFADDEHRASFGLDAFDEDFEAMMRRQDAPEVLPPTTTALENGGSAATAASASSLVGLPASLRSRLWAACESGDVACVRECVARDVDVNAVDAHDGYGAVLIAAEEGHAAIVEVLAAHGALLELTDCFGRSPLYAAAVADHEDVVRALAIYGADVEASDDEGRTPFFAVCALRNLGMAACLAALGADIDAADGAGRSPTAFATHHGHADVAAFLRDRGARERRHRLDVAVPPTRPCAAGGDDDDDETKVNLEDSPRARVVTPEKDGRSGRNTLDCLIKTVELLATTGTITTTTTTTTTTSSSSRGSTTDGDCSPPGDENANTLIQAPSRRG